LAIKQETLLQIEIVDGYYHKTAKLFEIKRYLNTWSQLVISAHSRMLCYFADKQYISNVWFDPTGD
jgi:hypothetical protein